LINGWNIISDDRGGGARFCVDGGRFAGAAPGFAGAVAGFAGVVAGFAGAAGPGWGLARGDLPGVTGLGRETALAAGESHP
jgi:hypothetical protein